VSGDRSARFLHGLSAALVASLAIEFTACSGESPPTPPRSVAGPSSVQGTSGSLLERSDPTALRLVTCNVRWNSIFPQVDPSRAERFARVARALDPDVLCLQEIGVHPDEMDRPDARRWSAADVIELLNVLLPANGGWRAFQGGDCVVASRFPLARTRSRTQPEAERSQAIALVDLPDERFEVDLYLLVNHFKCCDPERFDALRQQQADAIAAWLRDVRGPGGAEDLPRGTPFAVVGDLNLVGSLNPLDTLLGGDVHDEARFGPDALPDWDATPLSDLRPRHNARADGPDWTWRGSSDRYPPSRLDFVIYSDSVLEPVRSLVLDTTTLSDGELARAGLERWDTTADGTGRYVDHLPVVCDLRVVPLEAQ
jgi:endonuclease/exonuclease/phosphatase family metal-dependent hydrolase